MGLRTVAVTNETRYKKSNYAIVVPRSSDSILLHSTLCRSTAVLTGPIASFVEENDIFDLNAMPEDDFTDCLGSLIEQELLVPEDHDETFKVRYMFNSAKFDYSVMEIMLLTTMSCNFACRYYSEAGLFRSVFLDRPTVDKVTRYVRRIFDARRVKHLRVGYYGGEPLLGLEMLLHSANELTRLCKQYACEVEHFAITNGYLLTRDAERRLFDAGVRSFQVTLDGPRTAHDSRRPLANGGGTWDTIIENVDRVVGNEDLESFSVRVNVDADNEASIPLLLDELIDRGIAAAKKVTVYVAPTVVSFHPHESWNERFVLQGVDKAQVLTSLWKGMADRGIPVQVFPDYFPCGLRVDWASLIDPEGTLYTCAGLLGNEEYAKGSVDSDQVSYRHVESLEAETPASCWQCEWIPFCGGGCKYVAAVMKVDRLCERSFYNAAYPEYVRLRSEQKLAALEAEAPTSGCL